MKRFFVALVLGLTSFFTWAQAPDAINYQAVARDSQGEALPNKSIGLRFSIAMGGANGPAVYEETHQVTTNILGLFNVQIGRGTPIFGSLDAINWGTGSYFVQIEIDPNGGTNYYPMGSYELVSVPYALYAENAGNAGADLDEQTLSISNDTLFISNGNFIVLPADNPDLDEQDLILSNDTLYISGGNGAIALSDYIDDADADATNELQQLTLINDSVILSINGSGVDLSGFLDNTDSQQISISNDTLYLTGGGFAVIPQVQNTDEQDLILSNDTLSISNGNGSVFLGNYIDDADADSTNELQNFILSNDTLYISNGSGSVFLGDYINDADSDSTNELQDLSLTNDTLFISNSSTVVDLSGFMDNTDDQQISISNDTIYLENGGFVTIPAAVDTDEQDLIITGDVLSISNGNGTVDLSNYIDDADADPSNELQDLSLTNDSLFLTNSAVAVDLTGFLDNTDQQTLSLTGNNLSISNGNSVILNPDDADADPQNEIQALQLSNDTLRITNNPLSPGIDLGVYFDDTDNQTLTFDAATGTLGISGGNSISLPFSSGGDNWGTQVAVSSGAISGLGTSASPLILDPQGATSGMVLKWNGTAWVPGNDLINDADSDATNELNTGIQLVGTTLQVTDQGGTLSVDLSALQDGVNDNDADPSNELQTLSKTGNQITLSDGGGSITDEVNDADADPLNEIQTLTLTGTQITLSNGNTIDLAGIIPPGGSDDQVLSISNDTIYLEDGGFVKLPSGAVDTDDQTLSYDAATQMLTIVDGNSVFIPDNVDDADADNTNELQDLVFDPVTGVLGLTSSTVTHTVYDDWGTDVVNTDATLSGDGTPTSLLTIAQQGATDGDVLQWDNALGTWRPASGGGGTLDDAYNFGGPGAGRVINGISGAVVIKGTNGLILHSSPAAGQNEDFSSFTVGNVMYFNPSDGSFRTGSVGGVGAFTTNIGPGSFGTGSNIIAQGQYSAAFGSNTRAAASNSVSFGNSTEALGANSLAMGNATTAEGSSSLVFGSTSSTSATGQNSLSGGTFNIVEGTNSTSLGAGNTVYGSSSAALGSFNSTGDDNSAATIYASNTMTFGEGLLTVVRGMVAVGHWNEKGNVSSTQNGAYTSTIMSSATAFAVGTGTSNSDRRTSFTVLNDGNVGIGTVDPNYSLDIVGDLNLDSDTNKIYLNGNPYVHSPNGTSNFFAGYNSGSTTANYGQTVGIGSGILGNLTGGLNNVAIGFNAADNSTGLNSAVIIGSNAFRSSTGNTSNNTVVGANALEFGSGNGNTAIGYQAGDDGNAFNHSNNTFLGANTHADNSYSNSTAIGFGAEITASNYVAIGNGSVQDIEGAVAFGTYSDKNLKKNIQDTDLGLDFILQLRPVVYEMKTGHEGILYTGFIAQEVEEVLERMNADFSGLKRPMSPTDHYGLRYASFTVPLVNAVQEQQVQIQELREQNEQLLQTILELQERIEALEGH